MMKSRIVLILGLGFALGSAGNWVTSGGDPARTGLSDECGPSDTSLLWEGSLSGWFGLPVFISGDWLVTTRFQSMDYAPVVCHDLWTGETLWTRDFPGTNSRSIALGIWDSTVYAINFQESRYDTLYALNARTGSVVWRGATTVEMSISESVTFCPDGDVLVTGSNFRICRLARADGSVVWSTPRVWPVTGSCDICVYGNRAYAYSGDIGSLFLGAYDLTDGHLVDTVRIQDTHPGGPLPQAAPMVGPDGTIFAHKVGDNVTAIDDLGESLHVRWTHAISGDGEHFSPFSHFAVGPDSTVYIASAGRIQRLRPSDGTVLDSSVFVQDTSGVLFNVRLAIGADGTVYLATGDYFGGLYSFDPNLSLRWFVPLGNVNTSGPALGPDGVLAVAGDGTSLTVYQTPAGVRARGRANTTPEVLSARPNPFSTRAEIRLGGPNPGPVRIYDATGRLVRTLAPTPDASSAGTPVTWNGRDDDGRAVAPGAYICRAGSSRLRLVKTE
jgi:outer membrane protein assembly factor BamB